MAEKEITLTSVIATAIKVPGIRVNRESFLKDQFSEEAPETIQNVIASGPVAAGCTREDIARKAEKTMMATTLASTGASFVAGMPGGLAMAVTIPADILQFYGAALKIAQETAYLYGEADLWAGEAPDEDKVTNQLILYCGVMLGAPGAAAAVRLMINGQQMAEKMPQKALTGKFYYPVVQSVLKFFGKEITKKTFTKSLSKVIPVLGGIISGSITFAALNPMGKRLQAALEQANFNYTKVDMEKDILDVEKVIAEMKAEAAEEEPAESPEAAGNPEEAAEAPAEAAPGREEAIVLDDIRNAKKLLDDGIIDEREFAEIKERIISRL